MVVRVCAAAWWLPLVRCWTRRGRRRSPRAVAQRAGVAEATVFSNFGDRHGLLLALVREGIPEYGAFIAQVERGPQTSIDARLIGVFHTAWAFMRATMPLTGHHVLSWRGEPQDAPHSLIPVN